MKRIVTCACVLALLSAGSYVQAASRGGAAGKRLSSDSGTRYVSYYGGYSSGYSYAPAYSYVQPTYVQPAYYPSYSYQTYPSVSYPSYAYPGTTYVQPPVTRYDVGPTYPGGTVIVP